MNLRQLEVFHAVAETCSFTRASHTLFISQSTVSQHIRELEETLQVRLLDRNRRNVSLTPAGVRLLEQGRIVFQALEEAESQARTATDPYSGRLSFGCAATTLLYHLPPILLEYTRRFPNVELNITDGTIEEVSTKIFGQQLDMALVVLPFSGPGLEKVELCQESFVIAVPARHKLASRTRLNIEELADQRFILHRQSQNTRKLVDRFLYKSRLTPKVAVELGETEAIKAMVARGLGVSILPSSAFLQPNREPEIKTFPLPAKQLKRSLALVYPKGKTPRPPAEALMTMLRSHFAEK
jgi:LysR family hydrogen peroxide-inducible transcriptional activator